MRKIDKSTILSKAYKTWLDSLEDDSYPAYNSSSNPHYFDIKMSLLHCQDGLCAYTEQLLCDRKFIAIENWNEEKFNTQLTANDKNTIQGDLEHFDESLKPNNGWSWDNFFVVQTHVNCRIKGRKSVKYILKPDSYEYDENKYLQFDFKTGVFSPHIDLTNEEQEDVKYMIEILGINCIYAQRKKQLENWKDRLEVGLDVEPHEYVTAWKMTLASLEN